MNNIKYLICCILFFYVSCSDKNFNDIESIYGFWKQDINNDNDVSTIEINNSELIVYKLIWNEKYVIENKQTINLIDNSVVTINNVTISYKIEKGRLEILDKNHGSLYRYPFVKISKIDTIPFPRERVNFTIYLNSSDYDLNSSLSTKIFTKSRLSNEYFGLGGTIVINGVGNTPVSLYAYDLACPVEKSKDVLVTQIDYQRVKCEKCGTIFNIANGYGNPENNNFQYPLMKYLITGSGFNYTVKNIY